MRNARSDASSWRSLGIFANSIRVEIVRELLQSEIPSLSEIREKLSARGLEMTLPGLLKHMKLLEDAGIVRQFSGGIVLPEPDARKTIYMLEGKERVEMILQQLENNVCTLLAAGTVFNRTASLASKVLGIGPKLLIEERKLLASLLRQCELESINSALTEDEKKKVKLWRLMTASLEK